MTTIKLYNKPECPFCWKIRLALAELGINAEIIDSQSPQHIEEWRALTPRKTVPVLVIDDVVIYESNVILEYLSEAYGRLLPINPVECISSRHVNQYSDAVIGAGLREVIFEKRGKKANEWDLERIRLGTEAFEKALGHLSNQLGEKDFFSSCYSLPELALTARFGLAEAYGVEIPTCYKNLSNWFQRMKKRPSYHETAPQICL
ncbi:MAG: glutathione S-transferase family protein [Colwellia sp.]|nr:glutathione S-transferase family protein [Colwellia sp.]